MEGWEYCRDHPDEALDIVMRETAAAHVPTNRVHQRWMLDHVLASIFPGEHDSWQPGKLARVDYDRTKAIMIGEGQIETGPPTSGSSLPRRGLLRNLSIGRRLALFFVLGAGLVLAVVSYFTFVQARTMLRSQQRSIITQALTATSARIEAVEGAVEKVVQGTALLVEDVDLRPGRGRRRCCSGRCVRNDELVGSAVAYNPDVYGHVAPYAYMDGDVVEIKDLGKGGRAYEVGDWYQLPYQTRAAAVDGALLRRGRRQHAHGHLRGARAPRRRPRAGLGGGHRRRLAHLALQPAPEPGPGRDRLRLPDQPERHLHRPPRPRVHHERVDLQRGRGARGPAACAGSARR